MIISVPVVAQAGSEMMLNPPPLPWSEEAGGERGIFGLFETYSSDSLFMPFLSIVDVAQAGSVMMLPPPLLSSVVAGGKC